MAGEKAKREGKVSVRLELLPFPLLTKTPKLAEGKAMPYALDMSELVFEVTQEADGGYFAECLTESIVTEGNTWDELRANVREAVRGYYFDQLEKLTVSIRLHLVRDEVLAA